MESGKNPKDKGDEQQESIASQSKEKPKTMPKLMIQIPVEFLSERQKELLSPKPHLSSVPSTSSDKKADEHVFKIPEVPALRKKKSPSKSPSKALSGMRIRDSSLEESTTVVERNINAILEEAKTVESTTQVGYAKHSTTHDTSIKESMYMVKTVQDAPMKESTSHLSSVPSTSSDKKADEHVFKIPQVPSLGKRKSPSKALSGMQIRDSSLEESTTVVGRNINAILEEAKTVESMAQVGYIKDLTTKDTSMEESIDMVKTMQDAPVKELTDMVKTSQKAPVKEKTDIFKTVQDTPMKESTGILKTVEDASMKESTDVVKTMQDAPIKESTSIVKTGQDTFMKESTTMVKATQDTTLKESTDITKPAQNAPLE